jgi:hypothetical protein
MRWLKRSAIETTSEVPSISSASAYSSGASWTICPSLRRAM